jgi:hypothetical protein
MPAPFVKRDRDIHQQKHKRRQFQFASLHAILKTVIRRATTLFLAATVSFFALQPLPARAERRSEGSAIAWLQDASSSTRKRVESEALSQIKSGRVRKLYFAACYSFVSQPLSDAFDGRAPPFISAVAN